MILITPVTALPVAVHDVVRGEGRVRECTRGVYVYVCACEQKDGLCVCATRTYTLQYQLSVCSTPCLSIYRKLSLYKLPSVPASTKTTTITTTSPSHTHNQGTQRRQRQGQEWAA